MKEENVFFVKWILFLTLIVIMMFLLIKEVRNDIILFNIIVFPFTLVVATKFARYEKKQVID